ncbi:hypothetical protein BJ508DRAFT_316352, partial [Ascobolus immersus RN42]
MPVPCNLHLTEEAFVARLDALADLTPAEQAGITEHTYQLELFLRAMDSPALYYAPNKARLAFSSTKLLGKIVDATGVVSDPTKLEAIQAFKFPETVKELETFIGMVTYLGDTIPPSKYDPPSRASSTPPEESPPMQDTRTRERRLDDLFGTTPRDSNESDWSRPDPLVQASMAQASSVSLSLDAKSEAVSDDFRYSLEQFPREETASLPDLPDQEQVSLYDDYAEGSGRHSEAGESRPSSREETRSALSSSRHHHQSMPAASSPLDPEQASPYEDHAEGAGAHSDASDSRPISEATHTELSSSYTLRYLQSMPESSSQPSPFFTRPFSAPACTYPGDASQRTPDWSPSVRSARHSTPPSRHASLYDRLHSDDTSGDNWQVPISPSHSVHLEATSSDRYFQAFASTSLSSPQLPPLNSQHTLHHPSPPPSPSVTTQQPSLPMAQVVGLTPEQLTAFLAAFVSTPKMSFKDANIPYFNPDIVTTKRYEIIDGKKCVKDPFDYAEDIIDACNTLGHPVVTQNLHTRMDGHSATLWYSQLPQSEKYALINDPMPVPLPGQLSEGCPRWRAKLIEVFADKKNNSLARVIANSYTMERLKKGDDIFPWAMEQLTLLRRTG